MKSRNLPHLKTGVSGGQMWRPDPHSINPKIIPYHVEIFISNLLSHGCIFNIYGKIYLELL
jgi:hypothetical protein